MTAAVCAPRDGPAGTAPAQVGIKGWSLMVLVCLCLLNFLGFAATFSALGVTLPSMVADQGWSWTVAGLGFTLLGVSSAFSSFLPALLIRRTGVRTPLVLGSFVLSGGLLTLSQVSAIPPFLLGAVLCGIGFQLIAVIPGTHVLSSMFARRSLVFGIYMTSGSLGGVAGPWIVLGTIETFDQSWRMVWIILASAVFVMGLICAAVVSKGSETHKQQQTGGAAAQEETGFDVRAALRMPQFWLICGAYLSQLLILSSVASMSVAHLSETGTVAAIAAAMLSLEAAVQVVARLFGGAIGEFVNRKTLMMIGLACLTVGVWTLSDAQGTTMLLIYALITGVGIGFTALSSTLLLLEWFGKKHNLELFSIMCTLVAFSAINALIGGAIRDATGSFTLAYQLFGSFPALILLASFFAKRPRMVEGGQ